MTEVPEDIARSFPHAVERMRDLSRRNEHFGRLCERYRSIGQMLNRARRFIEPSDDFYTGELRKQRMMLRNQITRMIER